MKSKTECLEEVKKVIREEHSSAWTMLFFSILFSIISTFVIIHYSGQSIIDNCNKLVYGGALILNTFCIGYISAFVFYYLHDYIPSANNILDDYQVAYAPVKIVYDQSVLLENKVFDNDIPQEKYIEHFAERIIVGTTNNNLVQINPDVWSMFRLLSSIIEDAQKTLLLVRSDMKQPLFIALGMSLNIYKQIATKNWAILGEDSPIIEYENLLLVIKNFKKSLEDYSRVKRDMERFIYFDNYKYE